MGQWAGHTGEDFTLVLPVVSTAVMDLFLAQFAAALPTDAHAVLVLDGAGWHDQRALTVPDNLPSCRCQPTARNSTRSSGSGSTCASGSCPCDFSPTPRPSSRLVAAPGTPSPPSRVVSDPCAPIPGLRSSLHRLAGIRYRAPAKAGAHGSVARASAEWVPACAGTRL